MSAPKVSVLINTVNERPNILKDCLQSYIGQKEVEVEILISTVADDTSIDTAKSLGIPENQIIINPVQGINEQINYAVQFMTGDWFQYGSGNDVMTPNKLITEYNACIRANAKICYSAFYTCDENLKINRLNHFPKYDYDLHFDYFHERFPKQPGGNFVNDCSLIHRSIIEKYMPFRLQWGNYAFYDFWLRAAEAEGSKIFVYNETPTWYYRISPDSKHIKRQSNPDEQRKYMETCRCMLASHKSPDHKAVSGCFKFAGQQPLEPKEQTVTAIEVSSPETNIQPPQQTIEIFNILNEELEKPVMTVAIPSLDSKNISWLSMESLCRQDNDHIAFEVIVCEEQTDLATGKDGFSKYAERLKKMGCEKFIYIPLESRVSLAEKWHIIGKHISQRSIGFMLWSMDCYSQQNRIDTAFTAMKNGFDWVHTKQGCFYYIQTGQMLLYNGELIKEDVTHLSMTVASKYIRTLPNTERYQSAVDSFLFEHCKQEKGADLKIYVDETGNWRKTLDTQWHNQISLWRSELFSNPKFPFLKTDIRLRKILPHEICERLKEMQTEGVKNDIEPVVEYKDIASNTLRIKQCFVSLSVRFFGADFCENYGLRYIINPEVINKNEPCIFFGCYREDDYNTILAHKSLAVVCWAGSDSGTDKARIKDKLQTLNRPNIKHISSSAWCSYDLKEAGLKYIYLPLSVKNKKHIKALSLGDKIYVYTSQNNHEFYGSALYNQLINEYGKDKFIIAHAGKHTAGQMPDIYKQCFVGLRLVNHDGLSETVAELGLYGRYVIYNGCEPNALRYTDYDSIKKHIEIQQKGAGTVINNDLSEQMRDFLDVGRFWLNLNFWETI